MAKLLINREGRCRCVPMRQIMDYYSSCTPISDFTTFTVTQLFARCILLGYQPNEDRLGLYQKRFDVYLQPKTAFLILEKSCK